jgi:hypothetical protein
MLYAQKFCDVTGVSVVTLRQTCRILDTLLLPQHPSTPPTSAPGPSTPVTLPPPPPRLKRERSCDSLSDGVAASPQLAPPRRWKPVESKSLLRKPSASTLSAIADGVSLKPIPLEFSV